MLSQKESIDNLSKIAPLSLQMLEKKYGEEFLEKVFPSFFSEVKEINVQDNLYYFPLFLKRNQVHYDISEFILELLDYEFTKFYIEKEAQKPVPNINKTSEIYLNPFAQALQHQYDIHNFATNFSSDLEPQKNKTLLLISKDPTGTLHFFKAQFMHAAVIDELHDGRADTKQLLRILQTKYPSQSEQQWISAVENLKSIYFILEKQTSI